MRGYMSAGSVGFDGLYYSTKLLIILIGNLPLTYHMPQFPPLLEHGNNRETISGNVIASVRLVLADGAQKCFTWSTKFLKPVPAVFKRTSVNFVLI